MAGPAPQGNKLATVVLLVIGAFVLVLTWKILRTDLSLDTPVIQVNGSPQELSDASNVAALNQANERLLQMMQWTLGLVIAVGGLLVGYSWFQARSHIDDDRKRLDEHVQKLNETFTEAVETAEILKREIKRQESTFSGLILSIESRIAEAQERLEESQRTADFAAKTAYRKQVTDTYEVIRATIEDDSTDELITIVANFIDDIPDVDVERDDLVILRVANGILDQKLKRGDTSNYASSTLERLKIMVRLSWDHDASRVDVVRWSELMDLMIAKQRGREADQLARRTHGGGEREG